MIIRQSSAPISGSREAWEDDAEEEEEEAAVRGDLAKQ